MHYAKSRRAIERDVLPALGKLPVREISTAMVARAIAGVEERGAVETSSRIRQHVASIFDLARARGLRPDNPVVPFSGTARSSGKHKRKQPALTSLAALGAVLRAAETANLSPAVRMASWLLAHTVVRPGELVPTTWEELDLDSNDPRWTVPRNRMKRKDADRDHAIPLAPAVVERLREWRELTGGTGHVFPSYSRGGHVTRESLEKAYRVTLGLRGKHVPHGWRTAFSSTANDALDARGRRRFDVDTIEVALDHLHDGAVRLAYDRGERWEARRHLMSWWAEQLDAALRGTAVDSLRQVPAAAP